MFDVLINRLLKYFRSIHVWSIFVKDLDTNEEYELPQNWLLSRADPFIFDYQNAKYIIFEEFNVFKRHGYLAVGKFSKRNKKLENTNVIFRAPYHSSFPIVLDEICEDFRLLSMETEEAGNLSLYEYSHPYSKPSLIKNILNQPAVDPVFFKYKDVWYLFVSLFDEKAGTYCNNLNIYFSDDLLTSPFQPHPKNS